MDRMRNGIDYKISLLRIIATLSAVMLHVCSTLTDGVAVSWSSTFQFDVFALTQILLHWTIPVFFMITGFLLLGPEKSIGYDKVFRKYCSRIVGVLVIFGIPMAFIKIYSEGQGEISAMDSFGKALLAVLSNQGFAHFWYLYVLIGLPYSRRHDLPVRFVRHKHIYLPRTADFGEYIDQPPLKRVARFRCGSGDRRPRCA